jgi:hypothetical protein
MIQSRVCTIRPRREVKSALPIIAFLMLGAYVFALLYRRYLPPLRGWSYGRLMVLGILTEVLVLGVAKQLMAAAGH